MKKILLSAVSLTALTGNAFAADLPSNKAPVPPAVVAPLWTGFYAGLNAGYGWGTNSNSTSSLMSTGSIGSNSYSGYYSAQSPFVGGALGNPRQSMTQSGFIGGGQFGYNYQYGQKIVFGFETDIQGTGMRGSSAANGIFSGTTGTVLAQGGAYPGNQTGTQTGMGTVAVSGGLDYLGTARGRVGYLFTPTLLIYGTGGLAYGGAWANVTATGVSNSTVSYSNAVTSGILAAPGVSQTWAGGGNSNTLLVGYSAGGGLEWMFMPNWSLKGEALYYNLGNMNVNTNAITAASFGKVTTNSAQNFTGPGLISGNTSVNYQGVIARAGINYHFNFASAPIVAKY